MKTRAQAAFTVLELLIVVAIVATLAALLFPVLAQSKRYAKGTVDVSNMRQLYAAVALYENDHDDQSPLLLPMVLGYAGSKGVYASPLDPRKPDSNLGDWTPAPCGPHGYSPRVDYRVSYPYLPTMMPDDAWTNRRYSRELRNDSKVGMLASPWVGEVTQWDHSVVAGEDLANSHGPRMRGPIYRIRMDGSFFRLKKRRMEDCLGACPEDLFYFEN